MSARPTPRVSAALLAALLVGGLGGCPLGTGPDDSGTTPPNEPLDVQVEAPQTAQPREQVTLRAQVAGLTDSSKVSYRWYQVFGRRVTLDDPTAAEVHFTAPSMLAEQTLRFRVDVVAADGRSRSITVEVTVPRDPEFSLGDSVTTTDQEPRPRVRLVTSKGTIVVELDREKAPITVSNFLRYVEDGFYDGTIFHRVVPDFVIQGGGFTPDLTRKDTRPPIINESNNGLSNLRGTIAMARTNDPDSATSQFYINLVDNTSLDYAPDRPGYAVFGRVIEGMDVVDAIAAVETTTRNGFNDVPVENIVIERAERIQNQP